jgi:CheY-like chemotaxis protein
MEILESLNEAKHGATRMSRIVRDLRTFSRRDDDSTGPVAVNDVLDSSINIAMNEIRPRAQLRRDYSEGLHVIANEPRLGQVFLNLIINAAQAIPFGDSRHQFITVRSYQDDDEVVMEVSDTGAGMSKEVVARIFDAFYTTKPTGEGTGLGLSICQNIVEGLGGRLTVDTAPGQGSTFCVRLPAAPDRPLQPRNRRRDQTGSNGGQILIIDDDLRAAKALRRILHSHDVAIEHSGRDGLDRVADAQFDIIFCDMMMPDFGGIEFYEALSRQMPELAVRVIFVTGGTFTQRAREFLENTANDYVSKPYDAQEVRRMVNERLRR